MSLMAKAVSGLIDEPNFILIFGIAGVGKSTFASQFPKPYFLDVEGGSGRLKVTRKNKFENFTELLNTTKEFAEGKHDFKTLVLDSVDALEILIFDEVIAEASKDDKKPCKTIGDIPYGGGYTLALNKWKAFVDVLKEIRKVYHVVLIGHSIIKTVNDPNLPLPYDKHLIKLNQKAADYLKESVDAVLFACYEVLVSADKGGKGRAVGEGRRILHTMSKPGSEGKNRYGLPPVIDLDFSAFTSAMNVAVESEDDIKPLQERVSIYISQLKDPKQSETASGHYLANINNLEYLKKLEAKLKRIVEVN